MTFAEARALLHEWVTGASLRKHCLAVSTAMRHMARKAGADEELWAIAGLLHDLDYERFPNPERNPTAGHPSEAVKLLREKGAGEELCRAILSHADYCNTPRQTPMEKTLYAVDELTGLVVAAALIRPDKNVGTLEVSSVKKRLKDKAFARAVSREDVVRGAAELGVELDALIGEVITALRGSAAALGLDGSAAAGAG
jgi:putative nucleotidyltransferase with HDIG domain